MLIVTLPNYLVVVDFGLFPFLSFALYPTSHWHVGHFTCPIERFCGLPLLGRWRPKSTFPILLLFWNLPNHLTIFRNRTFLPPSTLPSVGLQRSSNCSRQDPHQLEWPIFTSTPQASFSLLLCLIPFLFHCSDILLPVYHDDPVRISTITYP